MEFDVLFYLQCLISSLLETSFLLTIVYGLINGFTLFTPFSIAKILLYTSVSAILTYIDSDHILLRIMYLVVYIVFLCAFTKKNIIHSIYITIISYSCALIIQFGIMTIFRFTAIEQDSFIVQLFGNTLTLLAALLISRFIPIYHLYDFVARKDIAFRFFLGNTFVIVFFINYLSVAHLSHFLYYFVTIIIAVALLIFVNIELLRSRVVVDKQKSIIDAYNKYMPIVDELIEHVRTRQHNHENELQALSALVASCDNYEDFKAEFYKNMNYIADSNIPIYLLRFNLKLLSGLLFQKYSITLKKEITMYFDISTYNIQTATPEYVIVEAVGILIDNAIEASSENDDIYITIDNKDTRFHFTIMNVGPTLTSELIENMFKRGYTTKSFTGHNSGLGLNQLSEIKNKYNGRLEISNKDYNGQNYLCFSIDL